MITKRFFPPKYWMKRVPVRCYFCGKINATGQKIGWVGIIAGPAIFPKCLVCRHRRY